MQKLFKRKKVATRETVELKEVVKQTIREIAAAITELSQDEELVNTHCVISPGKGELRGNGDETFWVYKDQNGERRISQVDFHLTIARTDKISAASGLAVDFVKIGAGRTTEKGMANTISFSIPVVWPANKANDSNVE